MPNNFAQAQKQAVSDFNNFVRPVLRDMFKPCHIVLIEARNDEFLKYLDVFSGIDSFIIRLDSQQVFPVSNRIQRGKNFRTFTIRYSRDSNTPTEFEKLIKARQQAALTPSLTFQAYISNETLLGLAVAKTDDLLNFISTKKAKIKHTKPDQIGQASFYVIDWDSFSKYYEIIEFDQKADGYRHLKPPFQLSLQF